MADYDIYALDDGASTWQKLPLPPPPQPSSFPQTWRLAVDPFDATGLALWGDNGIVVSQPVPAISALNRQSTPVGSAAFALVVTGTNFTNATTVQLNGVYRLTRFISSTQVETTLYAADLATPGTITVKVGWPGAAESISNGLPFAVTGAALQITRISPDSTHAVYTTNRGVGISLYSVSIIGGPAVKLDGPSAGSYDSSARVTSDSQTVVYLRRSQPDAGPKLYKVPIGGGTPVVLLTSQPQWPVCVGDRQLALERAAGRHKAPDPAQRLDDSRCLRPVGDDQPGLEIHRVFWRGLGRAGRHAV